MCTFSFNNDFVTVLLYIVEQNGSADVESDKEEESDSEEDNNNNSASEVQL